MRAPTTSSCRVHARNHWVVACVAMFELVALLQGARAANYGCPCHSLHGPRPSGHDICRSCHTMHYSENGTQPSNSDPGGPFPRLLLRADPTDVCLQCHYAADTSSIVAPVVRTSDGQQGVNFPLLPGGDFYFSDSANNPNAGHNPGGTLIGHDPTLSTSPGGNFPADQESCISCHDHHKTPSTTNAYRALLKKPGNWSGADLLVTGVENHPGTDENDNSNRPKYYSGFSAWCGACHSNPDGSGAGFHGSSLSDPDVGDGASWLRHPTDAPLGVAIATNFGNQIDYPYQVEDVDQNGQVGANDEVFCLSCHRAHATQYNNATRWDCAQASGTGTGCNKCHAKGG